MAFIDHKAGRLRHRVAIQSRGTTLGDRGQETQTFSTDDTVWAEIETLSGEERTAAAQVYATATHKVTIRYYAELTTKHRLLFGARVLQIGHIDNVDQRAWKMQLLCAEER